MTMGNLTTAFILPSIKCKLQSYTKLKIKKKKSEDIEKIVWFSWYISDSFRCNKQMPWFQMYPPSNLYYNMTVWILARKEINFSMAAGLIRLHMPGVK